MHDIDFFSAPKTPEEVLEKRYYSARTVINMDEVLANYVNYNATFQDLLDIMKYGFEKKEVRSRELKVKLHTKDKEVIGMETRHLLSNLIFWRSLIDMDKVDVLDKTFIFDFKEFNIKSMMEYINVKILEIHDGDFRSKNLLISDICHSIICISHAFCLLMGMGVSIYNIKQIEERYPEVAKLIHSPIDATMEPDQIEDELNRRNDRLIEILTKDPVMNDFQPLFASGAGIKPAQFREFIIKIGFKSDMNGNTIPIMIQQNFLMQGLSTPSSHYINALGGRKASILSKLAMGRPGALTKKLCNNNTSASYLREDKEICDSVGFITYLIEDDTFLKLLNGRYYYDQYGSMKCLIYEKDKHLIGKMVNFRSPITCASDEGICKYCYGELYELNSDMSSIGCLASLKITEPIGQGILSSKHSQSTHSNQIKFDAEQFDPLFELTSTEVNIRDDSPIDDVLYIKLTNVEVEEFDDSEYFSVNSFDVINPQREVVFHIEDENGAKLYLNECLVEKYKGRNKLKDPNTLYVNLDDLGDADSIFTVEVKSQELSDPLKVFEKLLNTKTHNGAETISELCQMFADSLIKMGTRYDLVHAETIIRSLVRKRSDPLEYPDFTRNGNQKDWQIMRLNDALLHNSSPLISMSTGYLRKQLLSPELYEKTGISHLDTLFVPKLKDFI